MGRGAGESMRTESLQAREAQLRLDASAGILALQGINWKATTLEAGAFHESSVGLWYKGESFGAAGSFCLDFNKVLLT